MAGFADLVSQSQPAFYGSGCAGSGTEGATWRWKFLDVTDGAGNLINLSGVTGVCEILTAVGGSVVATPTVTGTVDGTFTIVLDEATTAGLAAGDTLRRCVWRLTLSNGTDVVQVWGPLNSNFLIYPGS